MTGRSDTIITSFHDERIEIKMTDRIISINRLPVWVIQYEVMIKIITSSRSCVYEKVDKISLPYRICLNDLPDDYYYLHIYYKSKALLNCYIGLNFFNGYPFQIINNKVFTIVSKPFEENKKIFLELNEIFVNSHNSPNISYKEFIPESVVKQAHSIIRNCFSNYDKILAIHDWVAENIYYDYDSLEDESYKTSKIDALSVINRKRAVCAGYSELAVTLLKAVGVPATNMYCFALGISTEGDWGKLSNMRDDANHVITFAYANDRWIMLDTTWDSDNEYRNGSYTKKTGYGVSHQYFDCTLAFFSYTHRFVK